MIEAAAFPSDRFVVHCFTCFACTRAAFSLNILCMVTSMRHLLNILVLLTPMRRLPLVFFFACTRASDSLNILFRGEA
jgi:hypothetical protein